MKEKLAYLVGGLIVYFICGMIISYISYNEMDWKFIGFWTITMTLADFFLLRKLREKLQRKKVNNEK